mmetsp:Transcript_34681/g.103669  ORF Transcript_34681/g.103669 Transcript_34681/m.103669 type:complete len:334 (-) Transcript_34681:2005-3006(-)
MRPLLQQLLQVQVGLPLPRESLPRPVPRLQETFQRPTPQALRTEEPSQRLQRRPQRLPWQAPGPSRQPRRRPRWRPGPSRQARRTSRRRPGLSRRPRRAGQRPQPRGGTRRQQLQRWLPAGPRRAAGRVPEGRPASWSGAARTGPRWESRARRPRSSPRRSETRLERRRGPQTERRRPPEYQARRRAPTLATAPSRWRPGAAESRALARPRAALPAVMHRWHAPCHPARSGHPQQEPRQTSRHLRGRSGPPAHPQGALLRKLRRQGRTRQMRRHLWQWAEQPSAGCRNPTACPAPEPPPACQCRPGARDPHPLRSRATSSRTPCAARSPTRSP